MKSSLPYLFTLTVFCAPLAAQTVDEAAPQTTEHVVVLSEKTMMSITRDPQKFIETSINSLFRATASGVLTNEILATLKQMHVAAERSRLVSQILTFDLDGSFSIEPAEVERQIEHMDTRQRTLLETYLATADMDRDGTLSTEEIKAFVTASLKSKQSRSSRLQNVVNLMVFDANNDGKVTPVEIGEVVADMIERGKIPQPKSW